jgi:hypothetical protein
MVKKISSEAPTFTPVRTDQNLSASNRYPVDLIFAGGSSASTTSISSPAVALDVMVARPMVRPPSQSRV